MKDSELPKGYFCYECNRDNKYPAYVYAHWDIPLVHTCVCGAECEILRGRASRITRRDLRVSKNSRVQTA